MPITLNKAVKLIPVLLKEDKEYICVMKLHGDVSDKKLKAVLREFQGPIYQRPPLRSAVKRTVRIRRIYKIDMLERENRYVLLKIWCEAGTYIRKLCHDIGEVLGIGAHMYELRRTRAGSLSEKTNMVTLQDVVDSYVLWKEHGIEDYIRRVILPMEMAVEHIPKVVIRDSAVDAICHGAALAVPGILHVETGIRVNDIVAIFTLKGELVAIGKARMRSEEMVSSKRGIAVKTTQVLMPPDTYPPLWRQ